MLVHLVPILLVLQAGIVLGLSVLVDLLLRAGRILVERRVVVLPFPGVDHTHAGAAVDRGASGNLGGVGAAGRRE